MSRVRDRATHLRRLDALEAARRAVREAEVLPADPVAFAYRVGAPLGLTALDQWQQDVLTSRATRTLWTCSRQVGKTTTAALLALYTAVWVPRAEILVVCPSLRQSAETARRVFSFYSAIASIVPARATSALRLEFENGSRIQALPSTESTIRGFSRVALLLLDEAARISETTYSALRPMLITNGGRLLALSTPNGQVGWFWRAWSEEPGWERVRVRADECPRIPPEALVEERRVLGEALYQQEFEAEFVEAGSLAFRREAVEAAFQEDVEFEQWHLPRLA